MKRGKSKGKVHQVVASRLREIESRITAEDLPPIRPRRFSIHPSRASEPRPTEDVDSERFRDWDYNAGEDAASSEEEGDSSDEETKCCC